MLPLAQRVAQFNGARTSFKTVTSGTLPMSDGYLAQPQAQLIPPCMGVVLGFLIRLSIPVHNTGMGTLKSTVMGLSNLIESIEYQDPSGLTRVKASGALLEALTTARLGRAVGSANAINAGYPITPQVLYANDFPHDNGIAAGEVKTVSYTVFLPLTRQGGIEGAVPAFMSGSQQFININWRSRLAIDAGNNANSSDGVFYCPEGHPVSFAFNRVDYDVVMINKDFMISKELPYEVFGQGYFIQEQMVTGLAANGEMLIPLTFNRTYQNAVLQYDNGGTLYDGRTDINRIGEKAGASQIITDLTPDMLAMKNALTIENALPKAHYYFNLSGVNLDLTGGQYNLFVNPKIVNNGARIRLITEYSNPVEAQLGSMQ